MTDRERELLAALCSIDSAISAYLARLRGGEILTPLGSAFLLLDAIREDVRKAIAGVGE